MHQDVSTHSLDVPTSNTLVNSDAAQASPNETAPQTEKCLAKPQTIDKLQLGSSSDCKPLIPSTQYLTSKPPPHPREKVGNLTQPSGSKPAIIRSPRSKLHKLNLRDKVTVLYAGPELTKSWNDPAVVNTQDKPVPKIFFHHTYVPSEEINKNVCCTFGRHNDLQSRYNCRPRHLHTEEIRKNLQGPTQAVYRKRQHNSPVLSPNTDKSHPTPPVCTIEEVAASNEQPDLNKNDGDADKVNTNRNDDLEDLELMFKRLQISHEVQSQGVPVVDLCKPKSDTSSTETLQASNSTEISNTTRTIISRHSSWTDLTYDTNYSTRKKKQGTTKSRKRYQDIASSSTTSLCSMTEKIFRKRRFQSRRMRNTKTKSRNENEDKITIV